MKVANKTCEYHQARNLEKPTCIRSTITKIFPGTFRKTAIIVTEKNTTATKQSIARGNRYACSDG